jgi:hypothetical protein
MSLLAICVPDGLAFSRLPPLTQPMLVVGWDALGGTKLTDRQYLDTSLTPREVFEVASFDVKFAFGKLERLEPRDPWPSLYVKWRFDNGDDERLFRPVLRRLPVLEFSPRRRDIEAFGALVGGLVDAATEYAPQLVLVKRIRRGWLAYPHIEWELCDAMPIERPAGDGAFRTAQRDAGVVARRPRGSPFATLLAWLASSPAKPWRATPRELTLTHDHLYARFHDGTVRRLPRSALRKRVGQVDDDAVYVFGRGTNVVLPYEKACPVRTALDAQLERA